MVSNQILGARAAASLLILSALVGGCSHSERSTATHTAMPSSSESAAQAAPAPEEMTATEAAINAGGAAAAAPAVTSEAAPAVNPTAPMHYTVKRGDTLWGIASMYLKDPWHWPEVWVINPQIPNPHLIYPGDQLALAYGADGRPQVSVEQAGAVRMDPRLRSSPLDNAIPTIPYGTIAAFLSRPTVMSADDVRQAPYVLAFRDQHEVAGSGNEVYVRNYAGAENSRYAVMHLATKLRDPDDGKVLGYEAIYTATALVQRSGNPAKAVLIDSARETLRGDRLLLTDNTETPVNFTPRVPSSEVRGRIIDVVGGTARVGLVGQYEVVVLNRGKSQGIEAGSVLAVDQAGAVVPDIYRNGRSIGSLASTTFAPKVRLPDERSGTLLVFKSFDRMSYGLILVATDTIHVGDVVHNP